MELEELKSAWKAIEVPIINNQELSSMLIDNKHPILKGIRKQLTIEIVGWSAFLFCYYTMFDGDQKPIAINAILVISVLFALLHNISGYSFAKYLISGNTIKESLKYYLSKVRIYAAISIFSRIVLISGFLIFFTYNINFTSAKYLLLAGLIVVFSLQLIWLCFLWAKRLKRLSKSISEFDQEKGD